jgi:hypothetical protein
LVLSLRLQFVNRRAVGVAGLPRLRMYAKRARLDVQPRGNKVIEQQQQGIEGTLYDYTTGVKGLGAPRFYR